MSACRLKTTYAYHTSVLKDPPVSSAGTPKSLGNRVERTCDFLQSFVVETTAAFSQSRGNLELVVSTAFVRDNHAANRTK